MKNFKTIINLIGLICGATGFYMVWQNSNIVLAIAVLIMIFANNLTLYLRFDKDIK